jgi:hypothetical protein
MYKNLGVIRIEITNVTHEKDEKLKSLMMQ